MKNICILTFGTSDVQVNRTKELPEGCTIETDNNQAKLKIKSKGTETIINLKQNRYFHDWFLLNQPRTDGKNVLDNINILGTVIDMPLTIPLIENLHKENQKIEKFILVYTDQQDNCKDSEKRNNDDFRRNDSLYYAYIFKKILIDRFHYTENEFIDYRVHEYVTDYDYQFTRLGEDFKKIIPFKPEDIEKIYLLPQGGIDQINTSLTLQLIKCFGYKVEIYQIKEKDKPKKIRFAEIYLRDLTFDHIITLSSKGDYTGALYLLKTLDLEKYKTLGGLLRFGELKINALFDEINNIGKNSFDNKNIPKLLSDAKEKKAICSEEIIRLFSSAQNPNNDYAYRVSEYFEITRFFNKPENRNRFIMAFAIFVESFLNHFNSLQTGINLVKSHQEFNRNARILISRISEDEEIKNILNQYFEGDYKVINSLSVPVSLALALKNSNHHELIVLLCKTNGRYKDHICSLDDLRNDIAHRGKGISEKDFSLISGLFNQIQVKFTDKSSSFEELNDEIKRVIDVYRGKLL